MKKNYKIINYLTFILLFSIEKNIMCAVQPELNYDNYFNGTNPNQSNSLPENNFNNSLNNNNNNKIDDFHYYFDDYDYYNNYKDFQYYDKKDDYYEHHYYERNE